MAKLTFSELQDAVIFNLGQRTDLATYIDDWVNTAYIDLCTKNKFWGLKVPMDVMFPELDAVDTSKTTADGVPYVMAPEKTLYIRHVWDSTNDKKLTKITPREYVEKTGREIAGNEGKPSFWTRGITGTDIYLSPTPDDIYGLYIYYRQRPSKMTATTDTTVLDESWDDVVIRLATAQAAMRLKDVERIQLWKGEFIESMAEKMNWFFKEERDSKHYLKPDHIYKLGWGY